MCTLYLATVEHITDIIYNVTLVESNFLPKNECVTASKSLSQVSYQILHSPFRLCLL